MYQAQTPLFKVPQGRYMGGDPAHAALFHHLASLNGDNGTEQDHICSNVGQPYCANFLIAFGVTGVKRLIRLPSGSRKSKEQLPQGIVVGV